MKEIKEIRDVLIDYIPAGKENAITGKELALLSGLNYMAVTMLIHLMRIDGEIICSDNSSDCNGFYKPTCKNEIEKFVRQMKSRTRKINEAYKPAERVLKAMEECNIDKITY